MRNSFAKSLTKLSKRNKKIILCAGDIGNKLFDDLYMIQSNDEEKTKALLSSPKIQKLIHSIDKIDLEILDSEGIFKENYPENVDTVYFQCANRIDNIKKLKDLFNLFSEILKRLVHLGSAYEIKYRSWGSAIPRI